tara:strand:- start:755 stop:1069 length:315 start_codon:yes stop_codon:yes gene_type:complete
MMKKQIHIKQKTIDMSLAIVIGMLAIALFLTGCADPFELAETVVAKPDGFWWGLWHGMVCPFAFIGSLFNDSIAIYSANNKGGLYDFGFCLGVGAFTLGFSSHS